ncbi:transposase [Streptomyces venezuelae]|uniref:transposase n=1 Tax=Streptomyces venezuelae TaxID=54571 RepID=UPI0039895733
MIDGILHRARAGVQWRDLPERFGPWMNADERHRLWSADGTWERLLQQVQAAADAADEIDRTSRSTNMRRLPVPTRRRLLCQRGLKGQNIRVKRRDRVCTPAWWRWCCR